MADPTPTKIESNYTPGFGVGPEGQSNGILDGGYMKNSSLGSRVFSNTVNIDKKFVAGQDIAVGKSCALWGYVQEQTLTILANQATYVAEDAPTINLDGSALNISDTTDGRDDHALVSFAGMPTIPSGTGLTVLTIQVKVYLWEEVASDRSNPSVHPNSASFDETTVVWNNKPANTASIGSLPAGSSAGAYVDTGWVTITSTQYNNIKDNGVTFSDDGGDPFIDSIYSDDDGNGTANKPKIDVKFTYEIQDGKAYLASGLTEKYANSFIGFAQNTVLKGGPSRVRVNGVDTNQSGLTAYSDYELSDTPGEIQTGTSATWDKYVASAISETEIQINYRLSDASQI